ncbi:MAG: SDR family oxidoreductase [Promethearchaeota archaeon]|nr:MAG: SDR family oxidoreductase [Candidatus Lokiarchaeota archaeon]
MLKGKKVLITRTAGFIGSNLADRCLELGADVVGLDNMFNGRRSNLTKAFESKHFQLIKGDLRDLSLLSEITRNIDIIFHVGAFTSVPQSILMPDTCNAVNVTGTLNVLNAARKNDVEKVIFSSSSSVYGDENELPLVEDMPRSPISPYGTSKLAGESYMQSFQEVYGIQTLILRYFNVFGPRQKDSHYSGVIAIWLGCIQRNEPLLIFGDGTNSRDFTYVKDVVEGNLLAAEKNISGEIFNIGAGAPISLNDLAALLLQLTNKRDLSVKHTDPRPGDILHSYADISKAQKLLGFAPKYDQKSGLKDYFDWLSQNKESQ